MLFLRRSRIGARQQIFAENACHSERSEESRSPDAEILRFAQNDRLDKVRASLKYDNMLQYILLH